MATRKELLAAIGSRYRAASRREKERILDEFVATAGYHRKQAIRALRSDAPSARPRAARNRLYDDAVKQALIVLWGASDRLCGKRLKASIPILISSMERHGHLDLHPSVKERLLQVSSATIDRLLSGTRRHIDGKRRRNAGLGVALRRAIPVRSFSDWGDPPPGFFEVDMVEHCGGVKTETGTSRNRRSRRSEGRHLFKSRLRRDLSLESCDGLEERRSPPDTPAKECSSEMVANACGPASGTVAGIRTMAR
jgi:hypothetical protein